MASPADIHANTYTPTHPRQELEAKQINYVGRFLISDRAHIVFDFHQEVDGYNEDTLGRNKIGACVRAVEGSTNLGSSNIHI